MKSGRRAVVIIAVLLFAFGVTACQKRTVHQDTGQQTQQPMDQKKTDQEKVTENRIDGKIESIASKDTGAAYVETAQTMFADILFDYDRYDVRESYKPELQAVAAWMAKNSTTRLSVEGHCDERGTNEYNLALGDRRAKAVKDYLVTLGVDSGRMDVISYGEERPICSDQTEDCWTKNRRAHFTLLVKAGK